MTETIGTPDGAETVTVQEPAPTPRIIGVDFSLTATGVAVIDGDNATTTSTVKTRRDDGTIDGFAQRCASITRGIIEVSDIQASDIVLIEGPALHAKSSALDRMFGGWWLVACALQLCVERPVVVIMPTQRAKYATGKGNASKDAVLLAVAKRYAEVDVADNNEADALLMAAIGARLLGRPVEDALPQANLDALAKVRWSA